MNNSVDGAYKHTHHDSNAKYEDDLTDAVAGKHKPLDTNQKTTYYSKDHPLRNNLKHSGSWSCARAGSAGMCLS